MGQIQNSVNQMLGIGALIAGKARTDYNNSVMASENVDTKLRKDLYNKELKGTINKEEKKLQGILNDKFDKRSLKYTGLNENPIKRFFKNTQLRQFYESEYADRYIALTDQNNHTNKVTNTSKSNINTSNESDEYMAKSLFKEQKGHTLQMEQPSIQQVMAEQQMNKVDQINQFKNDTKEILNLRKDVLKNKGKYVVNMNTINGKPLNPNDTNNDIPTWKAKQVIAKQMELDSKNIKENK